MEYNDETELIGFSLRPKVLDYLFHSRGFDSVLQVVKAVIAMNRMFNAVQGNIICEGDLVDITLKVGHDDSDRLSSNFDPLFTLD
jgi:hypothetical protein